MDKNLITLIIVVLIALALFGLTVLWLAWPILREASLTNKRHKAYENRMKVTPDRGASISTPIKPENDFSPMFHGF